MRNILQFAAETVRQLRRSYEDRSYRSLCAEIENFPHNRVSINWKVDPRTRYWAHAGSGRFHVYGNSQEAFDDAIDRGFGVIEADVMMTADGVPVMSHRFRPNNEVVFDKTPTLDEFLGTKVNGKYTPLSLEMFIKRYESKDVYVSIDPSPAIRSCDLGQGLISYLKAHASKVFLAKTIYQINGLSQLRMMAEDNPFGALHYGLDAEIGERANQWKLQCLIPALRSGGVESVSITDFSIDDEKGIRELVLSLKSVGIAVVVAGVNSCARLARWESLGVTHINTDYLEPIQINER